MICTAWRAPSSPPTKSADVPAPSLIWVRRFILFPNKRHPTEMGESEIARFLTHLAVVENVAASTQNQALSAILFLYQAVLDKNLEGRARRDAEAATGSAHPRRS